MGTGSLRSALNFESLESGIDALAAQFVFNLQETVVFRYAFAAVRRTALDLSRIQGDGQVGNGCIFCFTGTVRNDGPIAGTVRHLDGFQRFRYGANLIELDEDGIAAALGNPFGQTLRVGYE